MQLSEGFIIKQFQNTIWVPNRLTQQRTISVVVPLNRRHILPKTPDEQSHSYQLQSTPRNLQRLPLGTVSAYLAQRHLSITPTCPTSASRASASPMLTLSSTAQLLASSAWALTSSVWPLAGSMSLSLGFYVDALCTLSSSLLLYSPPLSYNSDHSFNFLSNLCPRKSNS